MGDALSEWKRIEFSSFCQMFCNQNDVCDGSFTPFRQKRQTVRDKLVFKGSVFNESSKISMNVCDNSDIQTSLNSVLSKIKKERFVSEFCRIGVKRQVCDCNTFTKLSTLLVWFVIFKRIIFTSRF